MISSKFFSQVNFGSIFTVVLFALTAMFLLTVLASSQIVFGQLTLPETKIVAADGRAGSQFGAVGIDGNTLVVGAFGDTVGTNLSQGSAYIYVRSGAGWTFQQKLTAGDGRNGDLFGRAVGISGNTVVIGASQADLGTTAANQGALYVFVRNSNNVWTQQAKLIASDASGGDILGELVRMDGDTIIGGARGADRTNPTQIDSGAAYVFVRNGTNWTQQAKLLADDGTGGDNFGMSTDISGNTAVVGAWFDAEGINLQRGSAYIFTRDSAGQWSQQTKLLASDGLAGDWFGISSAILTATVNRTFPCFATAFGISSEAAAAASASFNSASRTMFRPSAIMTQMVNPTSRFFATGFGMFCVRRTAAQRLSVGDKRATRLFRLIMTTTAKVILRFTAAACGGFCARRTADFRRQVSAWQATRRFRRLTRNDLNDEG